MKSELIHHFQGGARRFSLAVSLLLTACVAVGLIEGKDFSWDFRNHHIYPAFSWVTGRVSEEFLAGGPQMYVNPIAALPLAGMVLAGWPDWAIVSVLSLLHGLNLIFIWLIVRKLGLAGDRRTSRILGFVGVALAFTAGLYLGMLGSTHTDAIASIPLLAALWLATNFRPASSRWEFAAAGLLVGAAVALKLSMAPMAVAVLAATIVSCALLSLGARAFAEACVVWALGALIGFVAIEIWPMVVRAREFGNPFFPFFSNLFGGELLVSGDRHDRFYPETFLEAVLRPLRMASPHPFTYVERRLPDLRPLAFAVLAPIALMASLLRYRFRDTSAREQERASAGEIRRARWALLTFITVAWILWLATSGNGRYALPLLLVLGPGIVLMAVLAFRQRMVVLVVVGLILVLQLFATTMFAPHRWARVPYMGYWYDVQMSERMSRQGHGFVVTDLNSNSFIFPYFAPESRFVGLLGQYAVPSEGAGSERWVAFREAHRDRLFVLGEAFPEPEGLSLFVQEQQALLYRYGLVVGEEGCELIFARTLPDTINEQALGFRKGVYFRACPLSYVGQGRDPRAEDRAEIARVFDLIEATCPRWFRPGGVEIRERNSNWYRRYSGTDVLLAEIDQKIRFAREGTGPFDVPLGTRADWLSGKAPRLRCEPLPRFYQGGEATYNVLLPE